MKRWLSVAIALGLYLTLRGYHSRDGDQAYRLPLLLHGQDNAVYANDPFVRAFDQVNPHRGYLAILALSSRVAGLSVAIFGLFAATFALTCLAIDRITKTVWPGSGARVGMVAVGLVLVAKAGNLGTNHLFEAMLLDRLVALALGWTAIAAMVSDPVKGRWRSAICIGLAGIVHPSLGLQVGMLLIAGLACWAVLEQNAGSWRLTALGAAMIVVALVPTWLLFGRDGSRLMDGLSPADYLTLSASIQGPQHMLPHLWRMPQWLAGACYLVVAALAVRDGSPSRERSRVVVLLGLLVAGLAIATVLIEVVGSVRITLFQPFRMATVARGLCLILIADRVRILWGRGDLMGQLRAVILVVGLSGDWAFVAATLIELSATLGSRFGRRIEGVLGALALGVTGTYLWRHDTEAGYQVLVGSCLVVLAAHCFNFCRGAWFGRGRSARVPRVVPDQCPDGSQGHGSDTPRGTRKDQTRPARGIGFLDDSPVHAARFAIFSAVAWLIPGAAMIVPNLMTGRLADRLAAHCRFGEWAGDDIERLAVWCRKNTPTDARFIGPPGPKTFRLWSRREVAFNRSASPYHAAGLADWAARFRDHVGFSGSISEFSAMYLRDRQTLERGFDRMDANGLRDLAERQRAGFVLASSKIGEAGSLERLRVEGRYAVYRVRHADGMRLATTLNFSGDPPARGNP